MEAILYYLAIPATCLGLLHLLVNNPQWGSDPESQAFNKYYAILQLLLIALKVGMFLLFIFAISFIWRRHFSNTSPPIFSQFLNEPPADQPDHGRAGTLIL